MIDWTKFEVPEADIRRREQEEVEDYRDDVDYGFGMKHLVIYTAFLAGAAITVALAIAAYTAFIVERT